MRSRGYARFWKNEPRAGKISRPRRKTTVFRFVSLVFLRVLRGLIRSEATLTSLRIRVVLLLTVAFAAGAAPRGDQSARDQFQALARQSVSVIDGDLRVPGLHAPVTVIRDRWGVPHIYAQNTDDLFMAQGYVMAQDRLWQMEIWRRSREGRLAEILGPSALARDRLARMMLYRSPMDDR